MARKPMVTRELKGVQAKVLKLDLEAEHVTEDTLTLKGKYKTAENLLKALQKAYDTDKVKIMKVIEFSQVYKVYGMPEEQFYSNAVEIDPETRKPIEK